jgi:hypothetical protein
MKKRGDKEQAVKRREKGGSVAVRFLHLGDEHFES